MDRKLVLETLSFAAMIVAFPVISLGATAGTAAVWVSGFVLFLVGSLLPVVTRFMDHSKDRVRDVGLEFDDRPS